MQTNKIGVLADTHLYSWPPQLLKTVESHFAGVELILHAGDIVNPALFDCLSAPVLAVSGNSDSALVAAGLPPRRVVRVNQFKLGLVHGRGEAEGLAGRVRAGFEEVDAIIFGHSHVAWMGELAGIFMLNPGSPVRSRQGANSIGLLYLGKQISGEIVRF